MNRCMKVSVLLFAAAREVVGKETVELELPDAATVATARSALLRSYPALSIRSGNLLWAVNNEYAADTRTLHATDVVACFPPVSGG
jgi:molybdopterin converting factor subunit 1